MIEKKYTLYRRLALHLAKRGYVMTYAEARRDIIENGIELGAGDFVDVEALAVAADALDKLSRQPAMKDHERIFFALCYNLRGTHKPRDVVNMLAETIPHKRCWYYLRKWGNLGFYDYGVTEDLGWFETDKIPQRYLEIVQETAPRPETAHETLARIIAAAAPYVQKAAAEAMEKLREQTRQYNANHPLGETYPYAIITAEDKTESGLLEEY